MRPANGPALFGLVLALVLAGCSQPKMEDQPKYEAYEKAGTWPDGQSARLPPAHTVARDTDLDPRPERMPMELTEALLDRGQDRYEVNCLPCHGRVGYADGMVVQRGFPAPPSLHTDRLREAPLSHFYDVITGGYGVMYSYANRVKPADRWAIAAYIRALQQSQHTNVETLDAGQREQLERSASERSAGDEGGQP